MKKSISLLALLGALGLGAGQAEQVKLNAAVAKPILLAGQKTITHLKVGLTGFDLTPDRPRTPINVAIVLDRSGSMQGAKLAHARQAAQMMVRSLRDEDIVSVVAYDDSVDVVSPATKAGDRQRIADIIGRIEARNGTALFAGVSKGAEEARKFLSKERVNRVVLLSDGLANIGPQSPSELGELGASLAREGISVTTIGLGLGYNEDLMTKLAARSDGRHAFIERPEDLTNIFKDELGSMMTVVAQKLLLEVVFDPGVRPVRALGREASIQGQKLVLDLNQLYAREEKYLLVEVEVPETAAGVTRDLAHVSLSYDNLYTKTPEKLASSVSVRFTNSAEEVERAINREVMIAYATQVGVENGDRAIRLIDEGKPEEARRALIDNGDFLRGQALRYKSKELDHYFKANGQDLEALAAGDSGRARKQLQDTQFQNKVSQGTELEKTANRR